jgi:hypothetical protein
MIVIADDSSFETDVIIATTGVYYRLGKSLHEQITKRLIREVEKRKK